MRLLRESVSCYWCVVDLDLAHVGPQSQQHRARAGAFAGPVSPPRTALRSLAVSHPGLASPPHAAQDRWTGHSHAGSVTKCFVCAQAGHLPTSPARTHSWRGPTPTIRVFRAQDDHALGKAPIRFLLKSRFFIKVHEHRLHPSPEMMHPPLHDPSTSLSSEGRILEPASAAGTCRLLGDPRVPAPSSLSGWTRTRPGDLDMLVWLW